MEKLNQDPALLLHDVSFSYPDGKTAVDGISLRIEQGDKVALIGPNGAGKSTLFSLLNGVLKAKGRIAVFSRRVQKDNLKWIRSKIGIVFQNPEDQLFCPTIYDDIAFGPKNFGVSDDQIEQRVRTALLDIGLNGFENRSALQLSFGEKKLASIATVLSCEPEIIVLDEPSSNLDLYHRRRIIDWIRRTDKTIFLASHDLDLVADTCRRVLIMREGRLSADGEVKEVLTNRLLLEDNHLELPLSLQKPALFAEAAGGKFVEGL